MCKQRIAGMTVDEKGRYLVEITGRWVIPTDERDDLVRRVTEMFAEFGVSEERVACIISFDEKATDEMMLPPLRFGPNRHLVFARTGRLLTEKERAEFKAHVTEQFAKFAQCPPKDIRVALFDDTITIRVSEVIS